MASNRAAPTRIRIRLLKRWRIMAWGLGTGDSGVGVRDEGLGLGTGTGDWGLGTGGSGLGIRDSGSGESEFGLGAPLGPRLTGGLAAERARRVRPGRRSCGPWRRRCDP